VKQQLVFTAISLAVWIPVVLLLYWIETKEQAREEEINEEMDAKFLETLYGETMDVETAAGDDFGQQVDDGLNHVMTMKFVNGTGLLRKRVWNQTGLAVALFG